jgi:integrase
MAKHRNPNGMGSYRLKADGRHEWRQTIDGKPRSISSKSFKELQKKVEKKIGLQISQKGITVEKWFDIWLSTYVQPLKKLATYNQYRIIYDNHIKPVIGHRYIDNITNIDIQDIISKMSNKTTKTQKKVEGKIVSVDTGRKLSTKTMKHAKSIMSIAFQKAYDEKYISKNPVEKIEIPARQAKIRKTLTPAELKKLFAAMQKSRWIWSIRFALITGLRRGEILALKWADVDFDARRILINKSNSVTGLGDTKNIKSHFVPLSEKAIIYLDEQKKQLKKEKNPITLREDLKKYDLVFPSNRGVMIRPDSYYTMLSRYSKKAGIYATPHCLRHSFVFYTRGKLSLKDLQNILGHDETTTTLDIYGNILNDSTRETAEQIDNAFDALEEEVKKINDKKHKKEGNLIQIDFGKAK